MSIIIPLNKLPIGQKANVTMLKSNGNIKRRMLDLGLIKDTLIEALYVSPSKDPTAYYFRGTVIALRSDEAASILVMPLEEGG